MSQYSIHVFSLMGSNPPPSPKKKKEEKKKQIHEEISELCQSAGAAAATPPWIIPRSGSGKWVNLGIAPYQLHILSWQPMEEPSASFQHMVSHI